MAASIELASPPLIPSPRLFQIHEPRAQVYLVTDRPAVPLVAALQKERERGTRPAAARSRAASPDHRSSVRREVSRERGN